MATMATKAETGPIVEVTSPLEAIKASLPPATDPLTFLTILEHNLKPELLPELCTILHDPELTSNIGWDLISLLTPLLPASESCLQEVARLGNPRECVLKTIEVMRELDFEAVQIHGEEEDDTEQEEESQVTPGKEDGGRCAPIHKFTVLLSLLSTIQPRIKSSKPSRFLSSTLQAVFATYAEATRSSKTAQIEALTGEVARFVKEVLGPKKRPHLPPRKSTQSTLPALQGAPDPEGHDERPSEKELALTKRLLQSFTTYIIEDYVLALDEEGLSWSARYYEKIHPEKTIPGRPSTCSRYTEDVSMHARDSTVGQLVALAHDLDLESSELLKTLQNAFCEFPELDGPPACPSDISLSTIGSLFLLTSRMISPILFDSKIPSVPPTPIHLIPFHSSLTQTFLNANLPATIGTEAPPLIDAIIVLGRWALTNNSLGDISAMSSERLHGYLQSLSLISANTPSPALRYASHTLLSSILHAHPSDTTRLAFIHDTLEHCPYPNLKTSAIEWTKSEILNALPDPPNPEISSIFATPLPLQTLAPYIFPDVHSTLGPSLSIIDAWTHLKTELTFYLASLNLLYLLLCAPRFKTSLKVQERDTKTFLDGLRHASTRFRTSLTQSGPGTLAVEEASIAGVQAGLSDLDLLDDVLNMVEPLLRA